MNKNINIKKLSDILDEWVASHPWAKGGYVDPQSYRKERIAYANSKESTNPIQQVRGEILTLAEIFLNLESKEKIFEIGMGEVGGTHFLFSHIFKHVYTLDAREDVILRHQKEQHPLPQQSKFFIGMSNEHSTYLSVCREIKSCDVLFIDGHHSRDIAESDWRMYHHLVREGGIIVFHDTKIDYPGEREVAGLVADLRAGKIDGKKYDIIDIHKSMDVGISYYIVT